MNSPETEVSRSTTGGRRAVTHVVALVHGIRDFALWQSEISETLERAGFKAEPVNYGRFDVFRFLLPFGFRRQIVQKVRRQLNDIRKKYPRAKISVISHSFGTWVMAQIIRDGFDIKFHRIIFCGSVVPYDFPFEQFSDRFDDPILNDVGCR